MPKFRVTFAGNEDDIEPLATNEADAIELYACSETVEDASTALAIEAANDLWGTSVDERDHYFVTEVIDQATERIKIVEDGNLVLSP